MERAPQFCIHFVRSPFDQTTDLDKIKYVSIIKTWNMRTRLYRPKCLTCVKSRSNEVQTKVIDTPKRRKWRFERFDAKIDL